MQYTYISNRKSFGAEGEYMKKIIFVWEYLFMQQCLSRGGDDDDWMRERVFCTISRKSFDII